MLSNEQWACFQRGSDLLRGVGGGECTTLQPNGRGRAVSSCVCARGLPGGTRGAACTCLFCLWSPRGMDREDCSWAVGPAPSAPVCPWAYIGQRMSESLRGNPWEVRRLALLFLPEH